MRKSSEQQALDAMSDDYFGGVVHVFRSFLEARGIFLPKRQVSEYLRNNPQFPF